MPPEMPWAACPVIVWNPYLSGTGTRCSVPNPLRPTLNSPCVLQSCELGPLEIAEPQRLLGNRLRLLRDGRKLLFAQRSEFTRQRHVLLQLRNGIDADDHALTA